MFRHRVVAELPVFSLLQFILETVGIRLRNGFLASEASVGAFVGIRK
jgi:hypothetical protein